MILHRKKQYTKAAIFDMDGLLIDTEQMWSDAEREIFGTVNINVTEQDALITCNMTTSAVTQYWYNRKPWSGISMQQIEQAVIEKVITHIDTTGCLMPGVHQAIDFFKYNDFLIGLATNAPIKIARFVLAKFRIEQYFQAVCSSDNVSEGKPAPDVYLYTAEKLNVPKENCIAFEDSLSGIKAARAAGMKTVAVSGKIDLIEHLYHEADILLHSLEELDINILKKITLDRFVI